MNRYAMMDEVFRLTKNGTKEVYVVIDGVKHNLSDKYNSTVVDVLAKIMDYTGEDAKVGVDNDPMSLGIVK